jgi:hypothetical protein
MKEAPKDDGDQKLEVAFKKFLSKQKKIKYEKFLKLQKEILFHISKDKTYYGMNIFRFEKQLRLHIIASEVKCLLECKNEEEENRAIEKTIALNDIYFPKLYQDFSSYDDITYTASCASRFNSLNNVVVSSSRLIIDALIEKEYFGEDWETLFLDTINEMTESVFYNPDEIDYTVTAESQEKFAKILSALVRRILTIAQATPPEERKNLAVYK